MPVLLIKYPMCSLEIYIKNIKLFLLQGKLKYYQKTRYKGVLHHLN